MLNTIQEIDAAAVEYDAMIQEGRGREWLDMVGAMTKAGEINRSNVPIIELFESFVPDGMALARRMRRRERNVLIEAGPGAIDTSRFSDVIGQITFSDVEARFEAPDLIGDQLVTTRPAQTQRAEVIPTIGNIGDQAADTGEGEEYPYVGFGPNWVTTPAKVKDGFLLAVTEELFREEQTGLLQETLDSAIDQLAITKEKECLDTVLGITNSYSRNNAAVEATYGDTHTNGDFDNNASITFVDYTDIEDAMRIFEAINDLDTGEPNRTPETMQIVCPPALATTMTNQLAPGTVVKLGADSGAVQAITSTAPLSHRREGFRIISNQFVKQRTSSDTTWFIGDFPGAFVYSEYFPLESHTVDGNHTMRVTRDIITITRVRRKGAHGVRRPWRVVKCT